MGHLINGRRCVMHLITIRIPREGGFVVSCPSKPRIFHDEIAETPEQAWDDLASINGELDHPTQIVNLAKRGAKGFRMVLMTLDDPPEN